MGYYFEQRLTSQREIYEVIQTNNKYNSVRAEDIYEVDDGKDTFFKFKFGDDMIIAAKYIHEAGPYGRLDFTNEFQDQNGKNRHIPISEV